MQVSIAMATFNGARFLEEQLSSILRQSRQPDELVVSDDGSSDATGDILARFRSCAPFPVHIYRNQLNLGFTKNFENAILRCDGDLVYLADQDDVWLPSKIGAVETAFVDYPAIQLVVHDGKLVDADLKWHGATKLGQILSGYRTRDALVMGAMTAARKDFLRAALPIPDGIVGHDIWVHTLARLLKLRLVIDDVLQLIRRHDSNTTDWVAASLEPIDRADVFFSQMKTAPATSYDDRVRINAGLVSNLVASKRLRGFCSAETLEDALAYLSAEAVALERRSELINLTRVRRVLASLGMFVAGNYRYFNGYKSFLRDIFRSSRKG
jgi:glycosyltransferase involved in cell wall biosynthesis